MPEGPEVYTIAKKLSQKLEGKKLLNLSFLSNSKYFNSNLQIPSPSVISKVYYYGKKIVFELEDYCVISFLGMTGSWNYKRSERTSAIMTFEDFELYYEDYRRFGLFNVCEKENLKDVFKNIGKDYIIDEITLEEFKKEIRNGRRKKTLICKFLLAQKPFAGIGNYLRADILYHSKIRPDRTLESLSDEEIKTLHSSIKLIMSKSVEAGGLTISDYWDPEKKKGSYTTLVYKKHTDAFGNKVITQRFDERTIHWVPEIQK